MLACLGVPCNIPATLWSACGVEPMKLRWTTATRARARGSLDSGSCNAAQVLGRLPSVLSIHRLSVTPVLGVVPAACVPGLAPCPAEVAAIFTVPLATFLGAAGHTHRDVPWVHGPAPGVRFRLHYFEHGELGPVWRAPRPSSPLLVPAELHIWGLCKRQSGLSKRSCWVCTACCGTLSVTAVCVLGSLLLTQHSQLGHTGFAFCVLARHAACR